ncbi:SIR2 family NAD-dependent protein deacylase [Planococcus soli]|uniref:SIR2 family NAD-dependent protein deacylase n=1 Tax=Planococcus soli TaxID=2666072 RepID=UPI00115C7DB5|nr:SIR2 family protein [Planococcus soli]
MTIERIIEKIRNNDVVLLIGSGFSLYAGMPSIEDIKKEILSKCNEVERIELEETHSFPQFFEAFVGMRNGSKNELFATLQNLIDINPDSLKYHKLISEIPQIETIITTNYDRLFEMAYGNRNIVPIAQSINFPYSQGDKVKLYKIHGDIHQLDSILITQTDFNNFFHEMNNSLWNKVKTLVAEKTILFIGFSYGDQNIEFLVDAVSRELGSHMKESFLLAPNMPNYKVKSLANKKIKFIKTTGEEFVEQLHSEVKKK